MMESYVDPDEMLIYAGSLQDYFSVGSNRRIRGLKAHIQQLQRADGVALKLL